MDVNTQATVTDWIERTAQDGTCSPSSVQDLMFELWGAVKETPAQPIVESWLTLTLERHLFSNDELHEALRQIRDLCEPAPVQ